MRIRQYRLNTRIISIFVLLCFSLPILSQDKKPEKKEEPKKSKKWDKFILGGNIGLQFGTVTYIDISPILGYYATPRLITGLGLTYQYYNDSYYSGYSTHIFGGRTFVNYAVVEHLGRNLKMKTDITIFVHTEYEALNIGRDFTEAKNADATKRFWLNGILLGGGIRKPIGKRSSFNFTVLYNILADSRTPYTNPIIRIGFFF
jgi:hypothetical protein